MHTSRYWTRAAVPLLLAAAAISLHGQSFANLWTFSGNYVFGAEATLIQGTDGNFYGITSDGGSHALGTVFKITPAGTLTTLYNFGTLSTDGAGPNSFIQGPDGNFYGTTLGNANIVGNIFKITPTGTLTTLFTFSMASVEGASPLGLINGSDGNFYGMTNTGGPNTGGTVFKMTPAGVLTTVYSFTPQQTGAGLTGTLVQGSDGNFYGTSVTGGQSNSGWVYKLTPAGVLSILYYFGPIATDSGPPSSLIEGTDGNFYGVTNPGSNSSISGTIYKITPGGTLSVLYTFVGTQNGAEPTTLIEGADGNFYGTAFTGGSGDSGTIFKLTTGGAFTTLYNFVYLTDGADPICLVQGANGTLYGTTNQGGTHGQGTIFSLTVPATTQSTTPTVTSVVTAFSNSTTMAPNTWTVIKGSNLSPAGDSRTWQTSDFVASQMPVSLDGVGVSMNGEAAYVYYISPTQLNVLTPPDLTSGPILVTVTNNGTTGAAFASQVEPDSIAFFVFNGGPYVVGTHLNGSDLGPTTLFPGSSTPATPGELVVLYGNGFGNVSNPILKGSVTQSGTLLPAPVIQIGGVPATVQFAGLISPGLYQFNVIVPTSLPNGDNALTAQYAGQTTQTGVLLTIQGNNQENEK
jgi:uncharacterized protein (TIGR03437 family)